MVRKEIVKGIVGVAVLSIHRRYMCVVCEWRTNGVRQN